MKHLLTLACFAWLNFFTAISQDLLQGNLIKGTYEVGFKQLLIIDTSRNYVNTKSTKGRPVIINMWYPAQKDLSEKIPYSRYLKLNQTELNNQLVRKLEHYNRKMVKLYGFSKKFSLLTPSEMIAFRKWKKSKTLAHENARAVNSIFPLIVYHQGLGAPIADNQAFCEYLASHGFVVCNAAYQSENSNRPAVTGNVNLSIPDMDIIIETARKEAFVDKQTTGLMGHSVGATLCMQYVTKGKFKVNAIALYDQGITYTESYSSQKDKTLDNILNEIWDNLNNYDMPVLYTASKINFLAMDSLIHSERTYVEVSELAHEDFTSNGVIGRRLQKHKSINQDRVKKIQENHELLVNYSKSFFKDHLASNDSAKITSYPILKDDQFRVWKRHKGENPTSGGFLKLDSTSLNKIVGTYALKMENSTIEIKLIQKDGLIKQSERKRKVYKKNGQLKKVNEYAEVSMNLVSEKDYILSSKLLVWGELKFNQHGHCIGFTSRHYANYKWIDIVFYERIN